jgi:hypothetical protein
MEIRFTKHRFIELATPRSLTSHETQVLQLLVRGSEAADCQVARATVAEECVDRCGSLVMAVPRGACGQILSSKRLLANAEWRYGNEGADVQDVLLFVDDGFLSLIETYRGDGEVPRGLPKVADLTILLGPDGPTPWPGTRSTQPDV